MQPVSVIIPTYDRGYCIAEAIEAVLSQTFQDFELIIVDDGSTDDTSQIVSAYANHLTYFYQENKGPAAARNFGIKNSTGKFISFLDSDDLWKREKLESQMDCLSHNPQAKVCYTNEIWIRNGVRVNQKKIHQKHSGWIFQKCLPLCIISPSSVIIHREVFEKVGLFDEELIVCEDYDLWLRMCAVYPVKYIDKPLIIKRGGHEDQLSRKFWGMDRFRVTALEKIISKNILSEQDQKAAVEMLVTKCEILANGCAKRGKSEEEQKYREIIEKYTL